MALGKEPPDRSNPGSMTDRTVRTIQLDAVRADGWFERLADGLPQFDKLCEVVGEKFLAFSFIAGLRITALSIDRTNPDATLVDFAIGEEQATQTLALAEFRRRLAMALISDEVAPNRLDDLTPSADALQTLLGIRYVLLAPLFDVNLLELIVGHDRSLTVVLTASSGREQMSIEDFRQLVRERIRAELQNSRSSSPLSIDLGVLSDVEKAEQNHDHDKTIRLLGSWPGPLAMLLRTPEGQQLDPAVRVKLARALGILGSAYVRAQRSDWAEEVLRLAIQWGQDGPAASELYARLGESYVEGGRHGEAIGVLRRSVALGSAPDSVLGLLARSYAARKKHVAALFCAEDAIAAGFDVEVMGVIRDEAERVLGPALGAVRSRLPPAPGPADTVPVPAPKGS